MITNNIFTKGAFVLGENDFRKSFSPKPRRLAATINFIFRKIASYWPKFSPLTRKWFFTLIFTSIHFRREREREREERAQIRERVREERAQIGEHQSSIAPLIGRSHRAEERRDRQDREVRSSGRSQRSSIDEQCAFDKRARRSTIAPLVARRTAHRSLLIHFLLLGFGFFCLIWCIFCKNIWMNQTPELIFRKTSFVTSKHMKTFSFSENSISGKWNIFRKCFCANQTQPK